MAGDAQCALFGKLPWAADYVRLNHVHPAALALDAWLQAAHQQLALAGASWPPATLRFCFTARDSGAVATGVLAPSRDRAGRRFPAALFATYPAASFARRLADVPALLSSFYASMERTLATVADTDRAQTERALAGLFAPSLRHLEGQAPDSLTATDFARALFEQAPERRLVVAATALARATWDARGRADLRGPVLDLPLRHASHLAPWLALVAPLRSAGELPPSLFWSASPDAPRALLALGPPPPSLLLWLTEPARRAERLRVLAHEPEGPEAIRLASGLSEASYQQSADQFFTQLAATFARDEASRG